MLNFANYITAFRILMIPVFLLLIASDPPRFRLALIVFLVASISDVIDGVVARKTGSVTPLGTFLDTMADKLLLVSSFVILTLIGRVPLWLTVIVILKDVILFFGWLGIYVITGVKKITPAIIGKVTTFSQIATIVIVILKAESLLSVDITSTVFIITAVFTSISCVYYTVKSAISLGVTNE